MKKERVKNKASDAFGDAWAKKRIEEAIDVEREITKELIERLEKASRSCGSCGMLWPDHGETCGLWVRREAVEKARVR